MSTPPTVPLLDLKIQYAALRNEIDAAIAAVVESQYFILGPTVTAFEERIADYCGTAHAVGCASGSDALLLSLMALGIGSGDEVLCPSYTFFATAGSIARLGARPVFVDIDPVTYNMDPEHASLVAATCSELKAIMPVHLYGQVVDMSAMLALGDSLGLPVIEDAAQAIGSRDAQGDPAGSRGTMGCFSFFPSKNLGGFGDGGMLTTNDEALADRLRLLRVHGGRPKYYYRALGLNSRLDALQAAVLQVKLGHLEDWHAARAANAARYTEHFRADGAVDSSEPLDEGGLSLRTPNPPAAPARHIYNQYVIRVPGSMRNDLREHLSQAGIGTEIYYPVPLHLQDCFADLGGTPGDLPETERAAHETLALPIYPELTDAQIDHVAASTLAFVSAAAPALS